VLVDPKDRTKVLLYEVYLDEKAFDAHQQTAHFKKYIAEAVPLLASRERQCGSAWRPELRGVSYVDFICSGGHFIDPYEQNTQQSPRFGRSVALQPSHS